MIGLAQRLAVEADRAEVLARGGPLGPVGQRAAAVLEVEPVGAHGKQARSGRRGRAARQALALPLAQAPEVAADLPRIDLPPGQMHVGALDQPPLVAGQRHPLGQHVVGVGQARAAVGPGLVGEVDAVLVQQPARLRQVADDRLVRVDEVGVRRAGQAVAAPRRAPVPRSAPPQTRRKPRSRYIAQSSSSTHERSSSRARCSARRSRPGSKPVPGIRRRRARCRSSCSAASGQRPPTAALR